MYYCLLNPCETAGRYMVETGATVRQTAAALGCSKSYVHILLTKKLPHVNPALSELVQKVLSVNKAERHLRGGAATKERHSGEKRGHRNA